MMKTKLRAILNGNRIEEVVDEGAAPDAPLDLLKGLVDLLSDPKAAQKRISDLQTATAKHDAAAEVAKAEQAKAQAARDDLADAQQKHTDRLAGELAAHTMQLEQRNNEVKWREDALTARSKAVAEAEAQVDKLRAELERKLAAIAKVAA